MGIIGNLHGCSFKMVHMHSQTPQNPRLFFSITSMRKMQHIETKYELLCAVNYCLLCYVHDERFPSGSLALFSQVLPPWDFYTKLYCSYDYNEKGSLVILNPYLLCRNCFSPKKTIWKKCSWFNFIFSHIIWQLNKMLCGETCMRRLFAG